MDKRKNLLSKPYRLIPVTALSNMIIWIVALIERKELK